MGSGGGAETVTLDLDATLLDAHSDKEDAAATYKGGYGFHPLCCFLDETNEALAGKLRSGNAGANNADDHIEVLAAAISQLPAAWQAGHEVGRRSDLVVHPILVRADEAGATHDLVDELTERNCQYSIGFSIDQKVRDALGLAQEEDWVPAIELDGTIRDGAFVIELTDVIDLEDGRGHSLLLEAGAPPPRRTADPLRHPRGHAPPVLHHELEGRCSATRASPSRARTRRGPDPRRQGDGHAQPALPRRGAPNNAWFQLVLCAMDLIAWTKELCLDGALALAEPKRLRYAFLHCAGRIVHSARRVTVRIQDGWPWQDELVAAFTSVRDIELC